MNRSIAALVVAGVLGATTALAGQDRLIPPAANGPGQGGLVRGLLPTGIGNPLYAAILGAGIYKSVDDGATWTVSNNGLGHLEVRTIRNRPGSITTLYVATDGGAGFYKSTDSGANWQASNTGLDCRFVRNAQVTSGISTAPGDVVVGTTCGAFRSTNEGATWSKICTANLSTVVNTVNIDSTGQVIRLATNDGVFFSTNGGSTCTQVNNGLIQGPNGLIVQDVRFVTGQTWIAAVQGNGVFVTTNNGGLWAPAVGIPAGSSPVGGFGNGPSNPPGSPPSAWWVALDGLGIYKSTDGGANWAPDATLAGLPAHMRFLFPGPVADTLWAATFAGVYKSIDSGVTWTKSSTGLPNGNAVNLAGRSTSLADVDLQTVYAPVETVYKSTNGGSTWAPSDNGLAGKLTHRAGGMTVDPNDANVLYVSTVNFGIYKSTDAGANWSPSSNGMPNLVNGTPDFRIAPSNSQILWATYETGAGVFRSTNGGATWLDMTAGLPVGDARIVNRPTIHPTNPDIVYLATRAGIFKSTNGGINWIYKSLGTPTGFPISRVEISTNNPQMVLAVTYYADALDRAYPVSGAYLSRNGGDSWIQLVGNEKIGHARLVENPGGSTDAYLITQGYFDEHYSALYKCVGLENNDSFDDNNCVEVAANPGQGRMFSLTAQPGRLRTATTTTGMYRQRFLFLGPDFNNDSRADIFWRNAGNGQNWVWLMNGGRFVGESSNSFNAVGPLRTVNSPWAIAAFGDFNGDGKTDVLWRNSTTGENYIYFMDRFVILPTEGYIRTITDQNWQVAGAGDFNNDGRADILWRNSATGENYVYFMNGLQILPTEGYVRSVTDQNWQVAGVGDLDGDQKADILWRNSASGENYVYPMDGLAVKPTEGYLRTVPAPWAIAGLGDFNQDDRMDIVWRNTTTGENYVYPMDGTTILPTEGYLPTVPDTGWSIVGLGDFEGSTDGSARGISDILWRHTSGSNYLWTMAGPTTTSSMCGSLGCSNGYLPTIDALGYGVVNK